MKRFSLLAITLAVGIAAMAQTSSKSTSKPEKLGKTELMSLIASASTPEQHMRLAKYYRAEAQRYSVEAADHQEQAAQYKNNPMTKSSKFTVGTVDHCDYIAESLKQSAAKDVELAQMHEQLGKAAESH
jgi:uncharacterized protein with von Willebrand factor type A (vWA) domain